MRKILIAAALFFLTVPPVPAQQRGAPPGSSMRAHKKRGKNSNGKKVHVRPYKRKNGTVVGRDDRNPGKTKEARDTPK